MARTKSAAKAASPVVVSKPNAMGALVAVVTAAPVVAKPVAVAVRGGLAIAAVKVGPKPYRPKAVHCVDRAAAVFAALQASKSQTLTAQQVLALPGLDAPHLGYMVRRGWLATV